MKKKLDKKYLAEALSNDDFIQWCHVSKSTARRWRRLGAPQWAVDLVRLRRGVLPWERWAGWRIDDDNLESPQGDKNHRTQNQTNPNQQEASHERYWQLVKEEVSRARSACSGTSKIEDANRSPAAAKTSTLDN